VTAQRLPSVVRQEAAEPDGQVLGFDYFCPGIRMGLQTAVALESAALLRSAHVDVCLASGRAARTLERAVGSRVANRVVRDIPPARIRRHPQLMIANRARQRLLLSGRDTTTVDRVLIRMYSAVARQCKSDAVVGTQGSCLELFEGRTYRILEQISPPPRYEREVRAGELVRFPGWEPEKVPISPAWRGRLEAEWQAADLIWVPSAHLISICRDFGADPLKFRVVPYPIGKQQSAGMATEVKGGRALRVVFVGTLMLEKGVQYIYEALRRKPSLPVQMEFFGAVKLTELGVRCLAEVGTVHGPVPRSQLFSELRRADVMLFPSLSEGSALATLEAAALGLPLIATPEAGGPASAMAIPSRSPEAIIEAIEILADDPARLAELSEAGLAEASTRNLAAYTENIIGLVGSGSGRE
jgi:glycosyltransferase involved in cell wall biosynthesis